MKKATPKPQTVSDRQQKSVALIIGIVSIILVFVSVILMPCPTETQYIVFRIIMALGAAGIAAVIPGFLRIKYKTTISAGGALAVLLLVYKFNPALIDSSDKCNSPFTCTIIFENSSGDGPSKGNATLRFNSNPLTSNIKDHMVVFTDIQPEFATKMVDLKLDAEGWIFEKDKTVIEIHLKERKIKVPVKSDNSLCCISGSVRNTENQFLKGIKVRIGDLSVETDENGRFTIKVPPKNQKEEYKLIVSDPQYETVEVNVFPRTKQDAEILLIKR